MTPATSCGRPCWPTRHDGAVAINARGQAIRRPILRPAGSSSSGRTNFDLVWWAILFVFSFFSVVLQHQLFHSRMLLTANNHPVSGYSGLSTPRDNNANAGTTTPTTRHNSQSVRNAMSLSARAPNGMGTRGSTQTNRSMSVATSNHKMRRTPSATQNSHTPMLPLVLPAVSAPRIDATPVSEVSPPASYTTRSPLVISWHGLDDMNALVDSIWKGNPVCDAILNARLLEDDYHPVPATARRSQGDTRRRAVSMNGLSFDQAVSRLTRPVVLNITFGCDDIFRHSDTGTGNFILAFYLLRATAAYLGNVQDVHVHCHDAENTKHSLVLPWLTGTWSVVANPGGKAPDLTQTPKDVVAAVAAITTTKGATQSSTSAHGHHADSNSSGTTVVAATALVIRRSVVAAMDRGLVKHRIGLEWVQQSSMSLENSDSSPPQQRQRGAKPSWQRKHANGCRNYSLVSLSWLYPAMQWDLRRMSLALVGVRGGQWHSRRYLGRHKKVPQHGQGQKEEQLQRLGLLGQSRWQEEYAATVPDDSNAQIATSTTASTFTTTWVPFLQTLPTSSPKTTSDNATMVEQAQKQQQPLFPNVELDDAVIHFRCGDLLSTNISTYGFMSFAGYARHISPAARSIGILTQPFSHSVTAGSAAGTTEAKAKKLYAEVPNIHSMDRVAGLSQQRSLDSADHVKSKRCQTLVHALRDYLVERHTADARISIRNDPHETIALTYARIVMANQSVAAMSTFSVFPMVATFGTAYILQPTTVSPSVFVSDIVARYKEQSNIVLFDESKLLLGSQAREMWDAEGDDAILQWFRS